MRDTRRAIWIAAQLVFLVAVVWYAVRSIRGQWSDVRVRLADVHPNWGLVAASALLVLLAYVVLIQTWRIMLGAWGERLEFLDATRIWFVSNLGRYLPGKVMQIAAMTEMAKARGVSRAAAAGSSLVVNLANILSGFLLIFFTGARVLEISSARGTRGAVALIALLVLGLALLPTLLPWGARLAARLFRRTVELPRIPARALWAATIGTGTAWALYGTAFHLLARALDSRATGATSAYIAVYTMSYLSGYLALIVPGGIGVRETMLVEGMSRLALASEPSAWVLAVASRLWLTAIEILPAVPFLLLFARDSVVERQSRSRPPRQSK